MENLLRSERLLISYKSYSLWLVPITETTGSFPILCWALTSVNMASMKLLQEHVHFYQKATYTVYCKPWCCLRITVHANFSIKEWGIYSFFKSRPSETGGLTFNIIDVAFSETALPLCLFAMFQIRCVCVRVRVCARALSGTQDA